ncbi:hypothetical protein O6H91_09G055500 [Diphasiastrum complanatum]|uniref:Uncharacterized protein n=2 Tax=Diphasiastrum complanatum TaxID=34168 RepID=A0ACC2CPA4_DIPCM|nr:hypothetical protein O6H91_09G055500 [Diphasiastrum complanatum]KAJ7543851.1 hypothetical protein O6H91_09G055500 [Diphasiastrum complanatum]
MRGEGGRKANTKMAQGYNTRQHSLTTMKALVLVFFLITVLRRTICVGVAPESGVGVYIVLLKGDPVVQYNGSIQGFAATSDSNGRKLNASSKAVKSYVAYLVNSHDTVLERTLGRGNYQKLYSYHHVINGVAVQMTKRKADILGAMPDVLHIEKDFRFRTETTHTPDYLGLPTGGWTLEGGSSNAGEGIVIGLVDTGVDPKHPSFSDQTAKAYKRSASYTGQCEFTAEFPKGSCNNKLVGARHFAAAAVASGEFNSTVQYESPLDADGHGTHTAATAAGNYGVTVLVNGFNYGSASGMAPRAQIAQYKAIYRDIGGFFADVVAAIDQAVKDGVDVLSLSIGPASIPGGSAAYLSTFDLALLSAVKAGVFVTQAAGNAGPYPSTILSFSPWIVSVAAGTHDRTYPNSICLGSKSKTISGIGLAPGTNGSSFYRLVLARDAFRNLNTTPRTDGCQDSTLYDETVVKGSILICTYDLNFLFGVYNIPAVVITAQNLGAQGIVLTASSEVDGATFSPTPLGFPAIIIPNSKDSLVLLDYYNMTTERDQHGKVTKFDAVGSISGGEQATFSSSPPQVASFSSRGPDINSANFDVADVLKPNIMAPGNLIWAAWTSIGVDEQDFNGQNFAMISGTSMATPHIAGIAALIKQKFPHFSPAAIASAITTTATVVDSNGRPLLAQNPSTNVAADLGPASPFDFGAGFVNPTAALDPGLIFDADYDDYVQFLCSVPELSNLTVYKAINYNCGSNKGLPSDLNTPSIVIGSLNGHQYVQRKVTNVAATETYQSSFTAPTGVMIAVNPRSFTIQAGESAQICVALEATDSSNVTSFGNLVLSGNAGHRVRISIIISTRKQKVETDFQL